MRGKYFVHFNNRDQFKYVTENGNSKSNHGTKINILTKTLTRIEQQYFKF